MSPLDVRKRLAAFANKLSAGKRVTKAEAVYLSQVFRRISEGEDANCVLGVKYSRGQSQRDALARQELSKIFQWVAAAIEADPDDDQVLSLEAALEQAHKLFRYPHDLRYLRDKWYENKSMQSPLRTWSDIDSPYKP